MKPITVDFIIRHKPCWYTTECILDIAGIRGVVGDGMDWPEFLRLALAGTSRLTCGDAVWLATRQGMLSHEVVSRWLHVVVERAIRRALEGKVSPAYRRWADRWLSGEDRSAEAAVAARVAAEWSAEAAAAAAAAEEVARGAWAWASEWAASAAAWADVVEAETEQQVRDLLAILEEVVQ